MKVENPKGKIRFTGRARTPLRADSESQDLQAARTECPPYLAAIL